MGRAAFVGVTVALLAVVTAAHSAVARPAATKLIDRTYSCATGYLGGIHQVQLEVYGRKPDPAVGDTAAYGELTSTLFPNPRLAGLGPSWLDINPTYCRVLRARGPAATSGLRGGAVGALGRIVDCETTARVVVRIRGVFLRPTSLRRTMIFDLTLLRAAEAARETSIALSTAKGKPIAVASIVGGKARLFTSSSCEDD